MGRLAGETALALIVLLASYLTLYYTLPKRTKFARFSMVVLFIACAVPLTATSLLAEKTAGADTGSHTGLQLALIITWAIAVLVLAASLIVWWRSRLRK